VERSRSDRERRQASFPPRPHRPPRAHTPCHDSCHPVEVATRTQVDAAAHRRVTGGVALILSIGFSMSACSLFPGDPGAPIAVQGSGSEALGGVLFLRCPEERVLSLTISRNDNAGAGVKPGKPLWEIEASQPSTVSEFVPGTDVAGFTTIVSAPPTISGDIVISVHTTSGTAVDGVHVRSLPREVVRFQGRNMSKESFFAKSKDIC
jgi:hypothetical protein